MNQKKQISYLVQIALPFILLGFFKSNLFFIAPTLIFISLPFEGLRSFLIAQWQNIGLILSRIVSPFMLGLIYYCVLTPLALLRRVLGSDPLVLKKPRGSNYRISQQELKLDDFDNLW
jgi:hypothetical protein